MPSMDLMNYLSAAYSIAPAAARTTSTNGAAVDINNLNSGNNGVAFFVVAGTITDGTHTFKLQDSPDNSTWTDVASTYQLVPSGQSSNAFTSATTSGTVIKFGYVGLNRYVRLVCTVTGSPATGGIYAGIAVLGYPFNLPAA